MCWIDARNHMGQANQVRVRAKANAIHDNIKAICDYGSNYDDGKLPVLNMKIWIGESAQNGTKILHKHYMKDVSSRHLLNYRSAHPEAMKLNVFVNEALRIMRVDDGMPGILHHQQLN